MKSMAAYSAADPVAQAFSSLVAGTWANAGSARATSAAWKSCFWKPLFMTPA